MIFTTVKTFQGLTRSQGQPAPQGNSQGWASGWKFKRIFVPSNTSHNQYVWDASKKNLMLYFLGVAYSGNSYFGFFGSPGVRCEKAIVWVWSSFYWRWTNCGQTCACLSVEALRLNMMFGILRLKMIFWTLIWIQKLGWCFEFEFWGWGPCLGLFVAPGRRRSPFALSRRSPVEDQKYKNLIITFMGWR